MSQAVAKVISPVFESTAFAEMIATLQRGDVVGIPTETVYGLAGNVFDVQAVAKIFATKERPTFDPLIVHIAPTINSLERLADSGIIDLAAMTPSMHSAASKLIESFWPGPLTIILPRGPKIPDLVTSGLPQVAVRMPAHPVAQYILETSGLFLAAPSANRFGRISPTTAHHVFEELGDRIPYIVDGGPCRIGVESTVINIHNHGVWLMRPGEIDGAKLSKCLGIDVLSAPSQLDKSSPGMLSSHYAPRKPLYFVAQDRLTIDCWNNQSFDMLVPSGNQIADDDLLTSLSQSAQSTIILSNMSDASEAARNLFAAMRELDRSPSAVILAIKPQESKGLWGAITDRLTRAAQKESVYFI